MSTRTTLNLRNDLELESTNALELVEKLRFLLHHPTFKAHRLIGPIANNASPNQIPDEVRVVRSRHATHLLVFFRTTKPPQIRKTITNIYTV